VVSKIRFHTLVLPEEFHASRACNLVVPGGRSSGNIPVVNLLLFSYLTRNPSNSISRDTYTFDFPLFSCLEALGTRTFLK
jgi:hypothetical protein